MHNRATQYLHANGLDWTSPVADIIDTLVEYFCERYPHWTDERIREAADEHALRGINARG